MIPTLALAAGLLGMSSGPRYPMDEVRRAPPPTDASLVLRSHPPGQNITVFVNFDGVTLSSCNPSDSHANCHWFNNEEPFEPFSGSPQIRAAILQAMRRDVSMFGIRVTSVRPPDDEDYTMVVYGGAEEDFGTLGAAPSGDCNDHNRNQIAFAHLDGDLNSWVNGGATTALHEAAHTWGLDHIDIEGAIMFPSGDDRPTAFSDDCDVIVSDVELTAGGASCPELNTSLCGDAGEQNTTAVLTELFGDPYVDQTAPTLTLTEPEDGQYFQAPATFTVRIGVDDDSHAQEYQMTAWLGDQRPGSATPIVEPQFSVDALPIGSWNFKVAIADNAGNESILEFEIEVGEDPPPSGDGGCACHAGPGESGRSALVWLMLVLVAPLATKR